MIFQLSRINQLYVFYSISVCFLLLLHIEGHIVTYIYYPSRETQYHICCLTVIICKKKEHDLPRSLTLENIGYVGKAKKSREKTTAKRLHRLIKLNYFPSNEDVDLETQLLNMTVPLVRLSSDHNRDFV